VPGIVPPTLRELLNRDAISRLAGPRSFERGEEYAHWGAVGRLRVGAASIAATVQGTDAYDVRIGVEDGNLAFCVQLPGGRGGAGIPALG
jgi:uncharacterized Zn finger protein